MGMTNATALAIAIVLLFITFRFIKGVIGKIISLAVVAAIVFAVLIKLGIIL